MSKIVKIELERSRAELLLEILERRLEVIQKLERSNGAIVANEIEREKTAIVPLIVTLEAALKIPPHQ
ncbi:hypothetical protein [Methylosinus sp. KRF6]|uniref:hypothetical protein n=1 Tax=Methylosinus sp. KRF6 TaxID=2846853 RepID=UPI001C0C9CA3|nr:hypothetical protein [Methylosinus sp. KRF6]MBU3887995.1 hypothetical protein [Methylosinus sp. KRF6]